MCKKIIAASLLSAFLLVTLPMSQAWAANTVQVTLPGFTVTLNGQSTGNEYSKYPLIVYKDITYFPMTYYDCRLLGLKTDWTADKGLVIDKNEDYFYEYLREVNNSKNAKKQIAKIADEKITVNGKVIDNSKEEYPLLVFRDITYFPLTWRFAAEEFGWKYHFDQKDGLVIQNDKVKLENPEEWEFHKFTGAGTLGRGSSLRIQVSVPVSANYFVFEDKTLTVPSTHFQQAKEMLQKYNDGKLFSKQELEQLIGYVYDHDYENETEWRGLQHLKLAESFTVEVSDMLEERCNWIDARMADQIYKEVGTKEELVYQYILPPLNGDIGITNWADYTFATNFWLNITPGTYKFRFGLPEYFECYMDSSQEVSKLRLDDIYYFEPIHNFTYEITKA